MLFSRPFRPKRVAPLRPQFEELEGRLVPATFTVTTGLDVVNPNDGNLSLREAISQANHHAGADTIVVPAGVFNIAAQMADDANAAGDFDVTDTVTIRGAGAGKSVVDGRRIDRVFDVHGTAPHSITVTLQGLTVRDGQADAGGGVRVGNADLVLQDCVVSGNHASGFGGGISNDTLRGTGDVTLVRTTVEHNVALFGGGVSVLGNTQDQGSAFKATASTILRNLATDDGGGVLADQATMNGCTITGNTAFEGNAGVTGANATLTNCVVSGNHAVDFGGGVSADNSTLTNCLVTGNRARGGSGVDGRFVTLTHCTVTGNSAVISGGGVSGLRVTLTGCTVSGNHAEEGGGVFANDRATLVNTTVSGNSASTLGGGVVADTAALANSTVVGNSAGTDGGGINALGMVTLNGSTVSGNSAGRDAGGVFSGASVTLTGSTVNGNRAATGDGGGIAAQQVMLTRSTVSGNSAGGHGGGITSGGATLTGSAVNGNSAGEGGGLFSNSATLTNCTVNGNTATVEGDFGGIGGGLSINAEVVLTNCTVSGNTAVSNGGVSAGTATLTGCTVSGNSANRDGGGLDATVATLTNSTVSGNSAGGRGGGINADVLTLLNVTVTDNIAHTGGGIFLDSEGRGSVRNTIVAGNLVDLGGASPDASGPFTSGGHNLIGDGSGSPGFVNGVKGDLVGTADSPIDPLLGTLANNGGPTQTHALLPGSPAINKGDSTDLPAADQRGFPRTVGGATDIGAFEVQPAVTLRVQRLGMRTRVDVFVDGALRRSFFPFGDFTGRVQVMQRDVNGDGRLDVMARAVVNGKTQTRTFLV